MTSARGVVLRLLGALGLAVGAGACAVALLATSGWLISRAAQQPPVLYLMVAIVAVRAFGIGRAVLTYAERLVGHDAAFRVLGWLRARVYDRLAGLGPARLQTYRTGELGRRLVDDVDAVLDLLLRSLLPTAAAVIVAGGAVYAVAALVPTAGLVLAVAVTAAAGGAVLAVGAARRSAASLPARRADLAGAVTELLHGLPDLVACGATAETGPRRGEPEGVLDVVERCDRRLRRAEARGVRATGVGGAVVVVATGMAACVSLGLAVGAVRGGWLDGTFLAVVVLVPLALGDVLGSLPDAAHHGWRSWASLRRVRALLAEDEDPTVAPDAQALPTEGADGSVARDGVRAATVAGDGQALPTEGATVVRAPAAPNGVRALAASPTEGESVARDRAGASAASHGAREGARAPAVARDGTGAAPASLGVREGARAHPPPNGPRAHPPPNGVLAPAASNGVPHGVRAAAPACGVWVERVTARWRADGPPVLDEVSVGVPCGGRVAVVGVSGSGKSTLANVVLGELVPESGTVTVGGVVSSCAQDAYVFDSTVAENVRLARPGATDGEVRDALVGARLGGWLATLPDGIHTRVGEHGDRVSGGERQRIALARTLLADTPVVVLDEPAEHLDEPTADALMRDLLDATAGRTVLLLTHREQDLDQVDEVYRLDAGGKIVPARESGAVDRSVAHMR